VNVQALASSFGDGTSLNSTIAWNFGDPTSQYNTLVGFNAAHAYASPGTYTITLTITTPDGYVGIATKQVTISPDTRPTIYVAANGNDSNNGLSASAPIQSLARLNQLITSNVRVLFRDGDTFDFSDPNDRVNVGGSQHVYIGSYGSGAQPILMYTGSATNGDFISMSGSAQGIVIEGLDFNSVFSNNGDEQAIPSAISVTGNDINISGNTFYNVEDDLDISLGATNVLVQNNNSPDPTALNAYFAFVGGSDLAFIGNTVASSVGEADFRSYANDVLIADNNWTRLAVANTGGKNVVSIEGGNYCYLYNNTFADGPVMAGPLGTPAADPNMAVDYVVYDSNVVNNSTILLEPGVDHVMAKNNVVNAGEQGDAAFTINAQQVGGGFDWQVQDVYIDNNTATAPGIWGGLITISDGEAEGIHVNNNLFVDPNYQTGAGAAFIKDNNDDMNSFVEIKDNVWAVPASVSGWAQGGYFWDASDSSNEAGWLTPAEWEATGIPTGDVYENVNLGATYSVNVDGFTAGSSLPTS
jgi:hypothetical protein